MIPFKDMGHLLAKKKPYILAGKVDKVIGLTVEVKALQAFIGELCVIHLPDGRQISAEVVGFRGASSILMPLGDPKGIMTGCLVYPRGKALEVRVDETLKGTILGGLGRPLEGPRIVVGKDVPVDRDPPNPMERKAIDTLFSTGVKAIDGFLSCGQGQRMGLFAGSGVGKSTLLGMISRFSESEVNVIALIGERGREVREFIENDLGPEGMKKSVVVCATSDQPPLVRLKGAFVATAIAEYFRDQKKQVLLLMDSVTRFAMAQREVGLAAGEPPATRGYPPSVFAMLPRLLERSGTSDKGSITAFYTVLVEGDDMNEPIADAVRGILDGHIVLSRDLAEKNHYPAIDISQSISRLMVALVDEGHLDLARRIRESMGIYKEAADLIDVGAYKKGSNPRIDRAIDDRQKIEDLLTQDMYEPFDYKKTLELLGQVTDRGSGETSG